MRVTPRICHITTAHSLDGSRLFGRYIPLQRQAGFDVRVVMHGEEDREFFHQGAHVIQASARSLASVLAARSLLAPALSTFSDLYHVHGAAFVPWALALKTAAGKTPLVWDAPALASVHPRAARGLPALATLAFDAAVAPDEATASLVRPFFRAPLVFHDYPSKAEATVAAAHAKPFADRPFDAVFQGPLHRGALETLLAAVQLLAAEHHLPAYRLLVVSKPSHRASGLVSWFENTVSRARLSGRVVMQQASDSQDLARHLACARVGVLVDTHQAVASLYTYLMAGLAVVSPAGNETGALVRGEGCVLFTPDATAAGLAKGLATLARTPPVAEAMGRRARDLALRSYTVERDWELVAERYQHLLGHP